MTFLDPKTIVEPQVHQAVALLVTYSRPPPAAVAGRKVSAEAGQSAKRERGEERESEGEGEREAERGREGTAAVTLHLAPIFRCHGRTPDGAPQLHLEWRC